MMDRSVLGHGVVALLALVAAWSAWTDDDLGNADLVLVGGDRLMSLQWQDPGYRVEIERREDDVLWFSVEALKEPDGKKGYPGSSRATELFAGLAPLKAVRRLGHADAERLTSLGLGPTPTTDEGPATLTLTHTGSRRTVLRIGNAAYGSGDRYALTSEGELVLLKSSLLSPLAAGASALGDRRLAGWSRADIASIDVSAAGSSRSFAHRFREDPKKAFFADPAVPDQKLDAVTGFIDRLMKLRAVDQGPAESHGAVSLKAVFLADDKRPLGTIELFARPPTSTSEVFLARSSIFGRDTTLKIGKFDAERLLSDVDDILKQRP